MQVATTQLAHHSTRRERLDKLLTLGSAVFNWVFGILFDQRFAAKCEVSGR
jgi:hypothetical protein